MAVTASAAAPDGRSSCSAPPIPIVALRMTSLRAVVAIGVAAEKPVWLFPAQEFFVTTTDR